MSIPMYLHCYVRGNSNLRKPSVFGPLRSPNIRERSGPKILAKMGNSMDEESGNISEEPRYICVFITFIDIFFTSLGHYWILCL